MSGERSHIMATTKKTTKTTEVKTEVKATKKNTEKKNTTTIKLMTNEELAKLFVDNGCSAGSKAKSTTTVYQQFGTKSRVLQQKKAYQLLLTNGHAKVKENIVDSDNDDTARFIEFYNKLSEKDKALVDGFDTIQTTKLSDTEMPRERTVKIKDYDLLVKFLKFMAKFEENKVVTA
jgi:hypothetical protein